MACCTATGRGGGKTQSCVSWLFYVLGAVSHPTYKRLTLSKNHYYSQSLTWYYLSVIGISQELFSKGEPTSASKKSNKLCSQKEHQSSSQKAHQFSSQKEHQSPNLAPKKSTLSLYRQFMNTIPPIYQIRRSYAQISSNHCLLAFCLLKMLKSTIKTWPASWPKRTFVILGVLILGRAVNLVYHASGFLRLCRRAVRRLARLTLIPSMTIAFSTLQLQKFPLKH